MSNPFGGMSQAEVNWLFKHFGGWSEVVDLPFDYPHFVVNCRHAAPGLVGMGLGEAEILMTVVALNAFVTVESGSRKRWAGKCPNCAKLYFRP